MKIYINKLGIFKRKICNIRLIMRLTTVMLMVNMSQVSASILANEFNYARKEASLIRILDEIKQPSRYYTTKNKKNIDVTTMINVNSRKAKNYDVLDKYSSKFLLPKSITDKMVTINEERLFRGKPSNSLNYIDVRGRVVDEDNTPLVAAVVRVKGTKQSTSTNNNGDFLLRNVDDRAVLMISFMGYATQEVKVKVNIGSVKLALSNDRLEEVEIVSTGYQEIPRERATGSFTLIDSAILNQRITTNILDKLDGSVSGLIFNRNLSSQANNSDFSIRGRSTIFANPNPLIILDNFPYDGDLRNINPNDIENITVLKDASAASIWGSRSGNGVIVISTKKGKRNELPTIKITSNLSIGMKPNIYSTPWIESSQFIELEELLFKRGAYNSNINRIYSPITPAVQVLLDRRNNKISSIDSAKSINDLKQIDARDQWSQFYYRPTLQQQYLASISGGGKTQKYFVSGGLDRNNKEIINQAYNRLTLNANNTYYLFNDRLELFSGITFTNSFTRGATDTYIPYTPYDLLKNSKGTTMEVARNLRPSYTDTVGKGKLLDWKYRPLDEINKNKRDDLIDYRLSFRVDYKILKGLNISLNYLYQNGISETTSNNATNSYYTRDLINTYSFIDNNTGLVTGPISPGSILNNSTGKYTSKNVRSQINYLYKSKNSELNILAGAEFKDYYFNQNSQKLYGYDESTSQNSNSQIGSTLLYNNYYSGSSDLILTSPILSYITDRYRSFFTIGSYILNDRYTVSASLRKDESNLFGVKANQKGIPLWSVGAKYDLSTEEFYPLKWLPLFTIRTSYGYNGNVDKSTSAYLTSQFYARNIWGSNYSEIVNPPNPSLRWEKIQNINIGIDFASKGNYISGTIEYFIKNGKDLIANSGIVPQSGITTFKGNAANTRTSGIDANLSLKWTQSKFSWGTAVLFNYSKELVTKYNFPEGSNLALVARNYQNPIVGYPYNSIFSLKYAGLDNMGNPIGYLNGEKSQVYASIVSSFNRSDLIYHGSATPVIFGAIRNTITWKMVELSFNVSYKLNYYLRRSSVYSGAASNTMSFRLVDFDKRWKQPGDELSTKIPALAYPNNSNRSNLFTNSEALVERADHIRFQYLQLSAPLERMIQHQKRITGSIYFNMENLGILWRKDSINYDPDYNYSRIPLITSLGLKINIK